MESRIRPEIEGQYGPITLITETSRPEAIDLFNLIPSGDFAVCDFSLRDIEDANQCASGYEIGRLINIDHHADSARFHKRVSSGNPACSFIRERGTIDQVIINHTDCDSIISAGIVSGLLEPKPEYEAAVIAADHTGEENDIADLLQSLQDERDVELSFRCLNLLESGLDLPEKAQSLLTQRRESRESARWIAESNTVTSGRLACVYADESIESELVAPFFKNAWVVAIAFPHRTNPKRTKTTNFITSNYPQTSQ